MLDRWAGYTGSCAVRKTYARGKGDGVTKHAAVIVFHVGALSRRVNVVLAL